MKKFFNLLVDVLEFIAVVLIVTKVSTGTVPAIGSLAMMGLGLIFLVDIIEDIWRGLMKLAGK